MRIPLIGRAKRSALRLYLMAAYPARPPCDLVRLGSEYGGWWVRPSLLGPTSVCLSAGVGEDATFDLALIDRFGLTVWAVDPTPRAVSYIGSLDAPAGFRFLPVGVWSTDGIQRFFAPRNEAHVSHSVVNLQRTATYFEAHCLTLRSLLEEHVHADAFDLVKLDVEGAEFEVLSTLKELDRLPSLLCVEIDQPAPFVRTIRELRRLRRLGYRVIMRELWNFTMELARP